MIARPAAAISVQPHASQARRAALIRLFAAILLAAAPRLLAAPAPDFGPNVLVFDPSTPGIQQQIDAVFARQERAEFGPDRYALLLEPGQYNLDVQVGFGTQVAGLGASPDEVSITGAVRSKAAWMKGNATINFWRSAENLAVTPTQDQHVNVWAVSQGTALRRVHIKGDLALSDHGWSSGGFLADSVVDGTVFSGTQQQWIARNDRWGSWRDEPGEWNLVFVGSENEPAGQWPQQPFTTVATTPVIREKPYLTVDKDGWYSVVVPGLRSEARGISWGGSSRFESISLDNFFLAHPQRDTAASINAALARGANLLLTPGIYHLDAPIRITRPDTVVFGLGYPTLVADRGTAAIEISDVDGVKMCGLLLQAGETKSPTLLQVGEPGSSADHTHDPSFLYDIFCRAGGAANGRADSFVTINSNDVVGDNWWLWRADHGRGAGWDSNTVANGLVVNGNNVTMYGLFVEHCQQYQTRWTGQGGRVFFYQSEMPYDPPSQPAWSHDGIKGYASYKVADNVTTHQAWGLGIYAVFFAAPVVAENAIETPTAPGIQMHDMVIVKFAGKPGSGFEHVINGRGAGIVHQKFARVE